MAVQTVLTGPVNGRPRLRVPAVSALLAVAVLLAACGTQTCKAGDNSRFRCDPATASATL